MEEWKEYKLEDIGKITTGKTPKTAIKEYFDGNILFVTPADINTPYKYVSKTARYLSEKGLNSISSNSIDKGSICVSCIGNIGYVGVVNMKCASNQQINSITVNKEHDRDFVYYAIKNLWPFFKNYEGQSTTLSILNKGQFSKIAIKAPQKDIQQRIASILSSLDDKIEVNRKINENLEQQAQALFKSWFVDFEPFRDQPFVESELGMIPKGWRVVSLDEACIKVTDGSHYSPKDDPHGTIPMLSVKDMLHNGFDYSSCKKIDEEEYIKMKSNDCVPLKNDILVAKDGSYLKEIFICNEEIKQAILSSIAIFRPNSEVIYPEILLQLLRLPKVKKDVSDNYVSGSALPRIVLKDFKKFKFVIAPSRIQNGIIQTMRSINKCIHINNQESRRLAELRDTLLPKLMSGEIKV